LIVAHASLSSGLRLSRASALLMIKICS
jgi:hypothetical protein